MKKLFASGAAIAALVVASVQAQQPGAGGATDQQGGRPAQVPRPTEPTDRTTSQPPSTQTPSPGATKAASLSKSDRDFMKEAAIGGKAEVELGQLASEKAQDPQVKQFGQQMVRDHGMANQELMQLARQKGVELPADLDGKHKDIATRLSRLSGQAFDRAYVQEMLTDHRKDVAEFREQSRKAQDADLKAFASKTLPTLEHHLSMVEQLSGNTGTSGTSVPRPSGGSGTERPATPERPGTSTPGTPGR